MPQSEGGCFKQAVEACELLRKALRDGKQALSSADAKRLSAPSGTVHLVGSVNIDSCLEEILPNAPRWDYLVGTSDAGHVEVAHWIEVHPASPGDVKDVLAKYEWLTRWLKSYAPEIADFGPRQFVWIASGPVSLSNRDRQKLSNRGIGFAGRQYLIRDHE
jgi:hypothetical protein